MKDAALERMLDEHAGRRRRLRRDDQGGRAAARAASQDAIPIGLYHGKMAAADRKETQDRFMADEFKAMIATNAFGLGIDKQRPALRHALPLSRARSSRTTRKPDAPAATASPRRARCSTASRTAACSRTSSAASIPTSRRRRTSRSCSSRCPLGEQVQLDELAEQVGRRAAQGAHRPRAAQAPRARARVSRRQLGAAARPAHLGRPERRPHRLRGSGACRIAPSSAR